jgi:Spy/CpxP family protein refolding chaperone
MIGRWCLTVFVATVAYAQPPIAWWENPVANGLTLSEDQRDWINRIVAQYRDRLNAERQDVERAEREFETIMNAETVDMQRGRAAIDQLGKARAIFFQDISMMTLRLRKVLTAEQWRTLQLQRGGRDGGKGRPEGRGRRGPPPLGSGPSR